MGHSRSSEPTRVNPPPMTVIATMGLSCTVSEINGDFSRKSKNFHIPCILHPADGVPLGIEYRRMEFKKNDEATDRRKSF